MNLLEKLVLILAALLVASWIYVQSAPLDPKLKAAATAPLVCDNKAQCDAYWHRARLWIVKNSKYGIEFESETVIQTQVPIAIKKHKKESYRVFKTGSLKGWTAIEIEVNCPDWFGCDEKKLEKTASFKRFVRRK